MTDEPEPPLDEGMDAALRDAYAFAPGAAEEAAARFRVPGPGRGRVSWILLPLAAAAGIAVGIWGPPLLEDRHVVADRPPPFKWEGIEDGPVSGFVSLATSDLLAVHGGSLHRGRTLHTGQALHEGDILDTPPGTRASIVLSDGTEVRLDRDSRVALPGGRGLTVVKGRIWTRVARGEPFLLGAGEARVTVLGTELSIRREPDRTEVQLFSGKARVEAGAAGRDLVAGQETVVEEGRVGEPRRIWSEAIATGWMLELVAHAGSHDRELAEHIDRLLEDMGHTKASMIEEETLVNDLGGSCRVPLARYLASEGARGDLEPRRKAARVLARIGDGTVARELAAALHDPDAEVRVSAAEALSRISAGKICIDPGAYRAACDDGGAAAAAEWAKGQAPPR